MKSVVRYMANWAGIAVGYMAGKWLWTEVLEEKANKLKERLSK